MDSLVCRKEGYDVDLIEVWHVVLPALQVVSFIILSLFSGAKRARRNANPGAAEADVSSSDSEDEEEGGPVEVRQERERERRELWKVIQVDD